MSAFERITKGSLYLRGDTDTILLIILNIVMGILLVVMVYSDYLR